MKATINKTGATVIITEEKIAGDCVRGPYKMYLIHAEGRDAYQSWIDADKVTAL